MTLDELDMIEGVMIRGEEITSSKNRIYHATVMCKDRRMDCVWKPEHGELDKRPGINGRHYLREVAAYQCAVALDEVVSVPTTVNRMFESRPGCLQRWLTSAVIGDYINMDYMICIDLDQWRWAAMFDYIIGNNDRHAGNWMVDPRGGLWLIDNGSSFPEEYDCWRGSLSVMRPMINRRVKITEEMRVVVLNNWNKCVAILESLGLRDSVDPMYRRVNTFTAIDNFADLVITR